MSVPAMVAQGVPPSQLIVVDSSDNHEPSRSVVQEALRSFSGRVDILHTPKGLTLQRNAGLKIVQHPIVFFPDDDSIWYPDVAEVKLSIYQRDSGGMISAVCGAESKISPVQLPKANSGAYKMRRSDRFKQILGHRRYQLENLIAPDPARLAGRNFIQKQPSPPWLADLNAVPVEWMTGFRMSFRTNAIRQVGFDENFRAYSLFEDIDASFAVWRSGVVVGARNARIFHFKSPERRDNGYRLGAEQILNKAYILAKHTPIGSLARGKMYRFARFKCFLYSLDLRDGFSRDRLRGAKQATGAIDEILSANPSEALVAYRSSMDRCGLR